MSIPAEGNIMPGVGERYSLTKADANDGNRLRHAVNELNFTTSDAIPMGSGASVR